MKARQKIWCCFFSSVLYSNQLELKLNLILIGIALRHANTWQLSPKQQIKLPQTKNQKPKTKQPKTKTTTTRLTGAQGTQSPPGLKCFPGSQIPYQSQGPQSGVPVKYDPPNFHISQITSPSNKHIYLILLPMAA